MAFECPRRSSPPSPMFDADTGCIATDPAPSARRRFRSKTGIENLPANEHAQETPHTPSPTRTTRRIQSGCAGSRPRLRDGMPGSPSQHIDITRAKWIPYFHYYDPVTRIVSSGCFINLPGSRYIIDVILNDRSLFDPFESMRAGNDIFGVLSAFADNSFRFIRPKPIPMNRTLDGNRIDHRMYYTDTNLREDKRCLRADVDTGRDFLMRRIRNEPFPSIKYYAYDPVTLRSPERGEWPVISEA